MSERGVPEPTMTADSYRLLVESVQDYAIFILDLHGNVVTWNAGAERIKGYRADEIIGRHFSVFYDDADVAAGKPERELSFVREHGRVEDEGFRLRKDGTRFWANIIITALRDASGTLTGFGKVTRDLTQRRQAEQAERELHAQQALRAVAESAEARLREESERTQAVSRKLEAILESIADGVTVQNSGGKLLFANSAAARACGFASVAQLLTATRDEIISRFKILDADGNPFNVEHLPGRRALNTGEPATALLCVRSAVDDTDAWFSVRSSAVLNAEGTPELAVNIWHEVTEEHRREQHERFLSMATVALSSALDHRAMLTTLANILVPGLADWCVLHLLDRDVLECVAVAHVDPAKVAFAQAHQRRYPPDPHEHGGLWSVVRTGRPELYERIPDAMLVNRARDDEHLKALRELGITAAIIVPIVIRERVSGAISLVSSQTNSKYDRHVLALAEEIGRRAGVAMENAKLYAAEKEASRIKEDFLATVSHELRTPLNAIVGWSSLLRQGGSAADVKKGVEVIHRNALAQAKIIEDILDVSRIVTGKLRLDLSVADLSTAIRNALEVVGPSAAAKGITIAFTPPSEPVRLAADHDRLQQVVWNLLSNAVKFTDAGGTVRVTIEREGSKLQVTVADTGRGIQTDFLPYVFDRFKQADGSTTRRVGGLGLGLAIVRHIVELHGGHVSVHSDGPGHGATFTFVLPIHAVTPAFPEREPTTAELGRPRSERPRVSLHGLRILVVDDESDARELLDAALTQAGATVETAPSAASGIALLPQVRPHVLVSDIGMPGEDGYTFIGRVRAALPEPWASVPAVALTAYTSGADKAKALAAGFTAHVDKPVNPRDLIAAIASLAAAAPPRPHEEPVSK